MGYKDIFDDSFSTPASDKSEESSAVTPLTPEPEEQQQSKPLLFPGFGSGRPLLLERPSRYIQRLSDTASKVYTVPDGDPYGGVENRILYSPVISLPVFLLQGNELFANHDVLKYPLLNPPLNHAWDGSDISVYMLTIIAAYTSAGILHEDVDGDVLAYDVEYPLSVADELWNAASDWASEAAPLLKDLNTARLLGFALKSPNEETDALRALFDHGMRIVLQVRSSRRGNMPRIFFETITTCSSTWNSDHSKNGNSPNHSKSVNFYRLLPSVRGSSFENQYKTHGCGSRIAGGVERSYRHERGECRFRQCRGPYQQRRKVIISRRI